MAQIIIEKMYYSYKEFYESIFENVNLNLDSDWKLGLIGRNGRGKTTLLRLLHGDLEPDRGKISKTVKTEFFPFHQKTDYRLTLDVMKEYIGGLRTLEENLEDMECLEKYLELGGFEMESRIKKEMHLVVSHDRRFLDEVSDHILSINKKTIEIEQGNYSSWKQNKDLIEQFETRTKERLEREVISLDRRAVKNRAWATVANTQKYPVAGHFRTNGSRAYMRQAKNSESRIQDHIAEKTKLLLNYEKEKKLLINQEQGYSNWLLNASDLSFRYDENPLIENFNLMVYPGDIIWLRGRNGVGKSTLLKLLSKRHTIEQEHSFTTGILEGKVYHASGLKIAEAYQEPLWTTGYIEELFTKENSYWKELCLSFDLPADFIQRPLETFSSGELKKIDIARALSQNNHLIFLDEPLNYMDIHFRLQLEKAIVKYKPTLIFVEHDEQFGENIANVVIDLD